MVGVVGVRRLDAVDVREQLAVALSRSRAQSQDLVELLELDDADRGLQVREAVVESEAYVMEPAALVRAALVAKTLQELPLLLGVRRHHPALARRDLLVGVEAERAGDAL